MNNAVGGERTPCEADEAITNEQRLDEKETSFTAREKSYRGYLR
jgi:hypothetical protein